MSMTTTAFDREVRILVCDGCGAPLNAPNQGGASTCRFCNATTMFSARAETAIAPAQPSTMTEEQRLWQLRQQDAKPLHGPSTLPFGLLTWHGDQNPKKYQEALAEWTRARLAIVHGRAAPHDEDHVYFLTLTISNYLAKTKEREKLRATLESAVEACQKPMHRQALYCMLARMAAKTGDARAAEAWLTPCDPRSANIYMDSEWRFAKAYLATRRADYETVFEHLGRTIDEIPIADFLDHQCAMHRANAHEKTGNIPLATQQLLDGARRFQGSPRTFKNIREANADLDLCPRSFPVAYGRAMRGRWARYVLYMLVWLGALGALILDYAVGITYDGDALGIGSIPAILIVAIVGFVMRFKMRA